MKKIIFILMIAFAFSSQVKAQEILYTVKVSVDVEYYLYDKYEGEVGHSKGASEGQVINVCAKNKQQARELAISQCSTMCSGDQEFGTGQWNGQTLPKYKRRTVSDAEIILEGLPCK